MADLQSVADAVRADLAAASLGVTLTVARKFDPDTDLKDIPTGPGAALVTVMSKGNSTTRETRGSVLDTITVDVGIRARVPQSNPDDACDDLSELHRKIRDYWWNQTIDGTKFTGVEETPWSVTHLTDQRVWVSLMTLTFIQSRNIPARGA
jgi:hypothetical protein